MFESCQIIFFNKNREKGKYLLANETEDSVFSTPVYFEPPSSRLLR